MQNLIYYIAVNFSRFTCRCEDTLGNSNVISIEKYREYNGQNIFQQQGSFKESKNYKENYIYNQKGVDKISDMHNEKTDILKISK